MTAPSPSRHPSVTTVLVAEPVEEPVPKRRVGEGRREMMRELEAEKRWAATMRRSEKAKAYHRE